jgi:hypothetical protein
LKNSFLVLSEQSGTKLKDCRKNQNQTVTKCFSKFGTKLNPNLTQTEPNPKELEPVATLNKSMLLKFKEKSKTTGFL